MRRLGRVSGGRCRSVQVGFFGAEGAQSGGMNQPNVGEVKDSRLSTAFGEVVGQGQYKVDVEPVHPVTDPDGVAVDVDNQTWFAAAGDGSWRGCASVIAGCGGHPKISSQRGRRSEWQRAMAARLRVEPGPDVAGLLVFTRRCNHRDG
jgi:hypothetical protein